MDEKKQALTKAIAILLSITPETPLGKLLRLCLETKVDSEIAGQTPLEVAREFIADPTSLSDWAEELICADGEVNNKEWVALEGLEIKDTDEFLKDFWAELETITLESKKAALTNTIAILLSITSETTLGRFFKLCQETKVDAEVVGRSPLKVAQEFIDNPAALPEWSQRLIYADAEVSYEELDALQELDIQDLDGFLEDLWTELATVDL